VDRYFYSIELNEDGNKIVHMSGNVYWNDVDETETNYRCALWVFFYITLDELKDAIEKHWLFEYLCENVKYEEDITEAEAIDACKNYFDGDPGVHMSLKCINTETPCGNYWCNVEEM
jgi:hypothetical protein